MTPEMQVKLKKSLILHEQLRHFPYLDTNNKITVGIGYNISDRGMSDEWIAQQYDKDVRYFYQQLCEFPWYNLMNEDRQVILIDMAFNLGWKNFLTFEKMLSALARRDYISAANEMIKSDWAQQVGKRAHDLANGMLLGNYNV